MSPTTPTGAQPFVVRARPAVSPLDAQSPLVFHAGFELSTRHLPFGGFSGLAVENDRLLAVSDWGFAWQCRLVFDSDGTLLGLADSQLGPLHDTEGAAASRNLRFDAEELSRWGRGWLVSFEGKHELLHYQARSPFTLSDPAPLRVQIPAEVAGLQKNAGLEAMTRLSDGRFFMIAEDLNLPEDPVLPEHLILSEDTEGDPGQVDSTLDKDTADPTAGEPLEDAPDALLAWVGRLDVSSGSPTSGIPGQWQSLTLEKTGQLHPTGAASLPSGDVLLLERSWNEKDGVRARLSILREADIQPGARLIPEELLRLSDPTTIDNFEAVAAVQGADGSTWIYLLSDDNFSESQKTLLHQLKLPRSSTKPVP